MAKKNEWICRNEKTLLDSSFMKLIQRECVSSEDERVHQFFVMKSRNWCNILPVTEDGKIVFVRQYRVGTSEHTLEIPGGVVDATDEDVKATALRELAEETGYTPLPGARCLELGWTHPNPAILDNRCFSFIVGPVRRQQDQRLDPGEMIEVEEIAIRDVPALVAEGKLSHALMLNAFFFAMIRSEKGASVLAEELGGFAGR